MKNCLTILMIFTLMLMAACEKAGEAPKGGGDGGGNGGGTEQGGTDGDDGTIPEGSVLLKLSMMPDARTAPKALSPATYAESGLENENFIKEVTVLMFGYSQNGTGVLQTLKQISLETLPADQTKWEKDSVLIVNEIKDISETKNIYVIANWATSIPAFNAADFVVGVTKESVVQAKLTAITGRIVAPTKASPLIMQGKLNHNFSTDKQKAEVELVRAVSKIRLRIEIDPTFAGSVPTIVWGDATAGDVHMRAVNVPNRSFVVGRTPSVSPTTSNDAAYALIHYDFAGAANKVAASTWVDSTYVYENPISGNTEAVQKKATYIIVHIPYTKNGVLHTQNYYQVYVGNAQTDPNPYKTERNYVYDIKAVIKGYGKSEEFANPDFVPSTLSCRMWR